LDVSSFPDVSEVQIATIFEIELSGREEVGEASS
jgi:hypothetical protein